ncbi:uncharacterized protein LOC144101592 [Amblyomma americanum]
MSQFSGRNVGNVNIEETVANIFEETFWRVSKRSNGLAFDRLYGESERRVLRELANTHKSVIECKKSDGASLEKKKKTWKLLTEQYNCRTDVRHRTEAQLRKCWDNLKEKWRRAKAADMKAIFGTGGGPPPPSQLDNELHHVGDVASHMGTRVDNPFDSDGSRYSNSGPLQRTPTAATLLEATQSEPQAEADEFDFSWGRATDSSQAESGEAAEVAEVAPDDQEAYSNQDLQEQQCSDEEHNTPMLATTWEAILPATQPAGYQRRKAAPAPNESVLATELSSRLEAVVADNKRKRKEHVLRVKHMKAQHELHMKHTVEMHALQSANKKAKMQLLQMKTAALKKDLNIE